MVVEIFCFSYHLWPWSLEGYISWNYIRVYCDQQQWLLIGKPLQWICTHILQVYLQCQNLHLRVNTGCHGFHSHSENHWQRHQSNPVQCEDTGDKIIPNILKQSWNVHLFTYVSIIRRPPITLTITITGSIWPDNYYYSYSYSGILRSLLLLLLLSRHKRCINITINSLTTLGQTHDDTQLMV